jgi:acetyl-CoA synthetase
MNNASVQDYVWQKFVQDIQKGARYPFGDQWSFFTQTFEQRKPAYGPPLIWQPGNEEFSNSNIARFMNDYGFTRFEDFQQWSADYRGDFWEQTIDVLDIKFSKKYTSFVQNPQNIKAPGWLHGAQLNLVDSCFKASDNKPAIIFGEENRNNILIVTYGQLKGMVNRVANGIREHGFPDKCGIALYMPMTVDCVAAYLGIIKAGCHVISIADSYSPQEIKRRTDIASAQGVITVDSYQRAGQNIDLYKKVIESDAPRTIVIESNDRQTKLRPNDITWKDFLSDKNDFESVISNPTDAINILFSSGTTGDPKAIAWNHTSAIKTISDGYFHQDIRETDVVAWPTNIGWMMGPWLIFATLANNATMALYNGAPHRKEFIDFVQNSGITILGTIPSLVRAWRNTMESDTGFWPKVRLFSSTGEPSNVEDYLWLMATTNYRAPVIEYCGGTEIGGGYITGSVMRPASPATFTTPALGLDFQILDQSGKEVMESETGELFIVPPSIGLSENLLNKDHDTVYYQDCPKGGNGEILRRHGDYITKLHNGFYKAQGRSDDSMNLGGIKVSSLELEIVVNSHPPVFESAAISEQPEGGGAEKLILYVVPKYELDSVKLMQELNTLFAEKLNPLFKINKLLIIDKLPRTASNKIMRRLLRDKINSSI